METTKNKLTQEETIFFQNLRDYLDTPIYFYGSIQRDDYLPEYSDIDVDIFTNSENSIIIKLENYLNVKRNDFQKTLCIMDNKKRVVPGYKIKYNNEDKKINVEFSIFNEKYKKYVIESQKSKFSLSYYTCIILLVLKSLYYKFNIIPFKLFRQLKNYLIGITEEDKKNFIILDININ
jgi:predicted nucleotidyltransferase